MNNEEKILGLLEKMDGRLEKLEAGQQALEEGQKDLRINVLELRTNMTALERKHGTLSMQYHNLDGKAESIHNSMLNIEHTYLPEIKAAFEGYQSVNQKNHELDKRLRVAEAKIERQGIEHFALKEKTRALVE